jgi:hypothetical protein
MNISLIISLSEKNLLKNFNGSIAYRLSFDLFSLKICFSRILVGFSFALLLPPHFRDLNGFVGAALPFY